MIYKNPSCVPQVIAIIIAVDWDSFQYEFVVCSQVSLSPPYGISPWMTNSPYDSSFEVARSHIQQDKEKSPWGGGFPFNHWMQVMNEWIYIFSL